MTEKPTPIAEVSFEERTAVLFDDGAVVTLGVGDGSCSEHRSLEDEQCDHAAGTKKTVPSFDGEMLVGAADTDTIIQNGVLSRLMDNDPERLAAIGADL